VSFARIAAYLPTRRLSDFGAQADAPAPGPTGRSTETASIPTGGFGPQLTDLHAWLDENCGADGWAMTPAGLRGVVSDAVAIYFLYATLAAAFVSRWCSGSRVEISEGASGCRRISRHRGLKPDRIRRFGGRHRREPETR
jgi:hypothetical protein